MNSSLAVWLSCWYNVDEEHSNLLTSDNHMRSDRGSLKPTRTHSAFIKKLLVLFDFDFIIFNFCQETNSLEFLLISDYICKLYHYMD